MFKCIDCICHLLSKSCYNFSLQMSDLQPHHHVLRRVCISDYLNLESDQALVNRLIETGCANEELKHNNMHLSKKIQKRYIAWFHNQSYELFLNFLECLRRDDKYSKLVHMLDKALTEYIDPSECCSITKLKTTGE